MSTARCQKNTIYRRDCKIYIARSLFW